MSIEALVAPAPAVLCAAAARPDVTSAMNEAHAALADLRFSEGLRRGWEEARAEAAVREAAALSIIEGARTSVDDVRALSMADDGGAASDPGAALALGIWRSQWNLASRFPALNTRSHGGARVAPTPLPALIAGLHRDACSGLVAAGLVESRCVAVPADPSLLAPALAYARCDAPGLAVAAALGAETACSRPLAETVDWMPKSRCIGVSGQKVHPDLYIAVGISGQMQHMAGARDSKTIVLINSDAEAPIFAQADYGVVGDLTTVLPALAKALQ